MYIEHLDGRFAGVVQDIETSAALGLISVGRARRHSFDGPAPEAPVVEAAIVPVEETKPSKKKSR